MEFLETKNKKFHSKVTDFKQLAFEMEHQENIHLQNPLMDSPTFQTEISNIKNLQEEMRSQQGLFKQEMEMQHRTLNSVVHIVRKREQPAAPTTCRGQGGDTS